ncbi:MAG: hypothetical protein FJ096_00010 [Deltaproteobacteria bacterium]|nr:hypothetical protein [Deltaproteobacteria bacterium]
MRRGGISLLSGALLLAACGRGPALPAEAPRRTLAGAPRSRDAAPVAQPRPRWFYHPSTSTPTDGIALEDGRWLLVGARGERWIASLDQGRLVADAVPDLAPLGLRHVARTPNGGFRLVGDHGAVFEARGPAAPLTLVATPPRALESFAGRGTTLLGVDAFGALMRLDGLRWVDVPLDVPVFQLAEGHAGFVGLSFPERWTIGDPSGMRWRSLGAPPVGAFQLVEESAGTVWVGATAGARRWLADGSFETLSGSPSPPRRPWSEVVLRRGPSATALVEGRASLSVEGFAQLEQVRGATGWTFTFAEGPLGTPLTERTIAPRLEGACDAPRFAARADHLVLVCREDPTFVVHQSHDRGRNWTRRAIPSLERDGDLEVAIGPSGTVLLLGEVACSSGRCPELLRATASVSTFNPVPVAWAPRELGDRDGAVAGWLEWRGPRPIVIASTAKEGLRPFVSDDDGTTFHAVSLEGHGEQARSFVRDFSDASVPGERRARESPDGKLSLVIEGSRPRGAQLDSTGKVSHVIDPSRADPVVALSGAGARWLALRRASVGSPSLSVWQSLDGGRTFDPIDTPVPLRAEPGETVPLDCGDAGCVVGAELVRTGWASEDRRPFAPEASPRVSPTERRVRTTIACRASQPGILQLHHVEDGALPTSEDAFRGRTTWSLLVREPNGAAAVVSGLLAGGPGGRRTRRELLLPPREKLRAAERIDAQAEGWTGVRARPVPGAGLRYEVAWVDLVHERRMRGMARSSVDRPDLFGAGAHPFLHGVDASITTRGAVLRIRGGEEVFAFDPRGTPTGPLSYPGWPDLPLDRIESAIDEGAPRMLALHLGDGAIFRTVSVVEPTGGARLDLAVAPSAGHHREVTTHWSRSGPHPGIAVSVLERDRSRAMAYFVEVPRSPSSPTPVAVPTQRDLREPYRACTRDDVAGSPRVLAPYLVGTRHPVTIEGLSEPMMTSEAVLHGDPASPCLLGWVADPPSPGGARAFLPADLEASWLLRVSRGERVGVEATPVRCEFVTDREPPPWTDSFAATEGER